MKSFTFFLMLVMLGACSLFQNRDELLTKDVWIMEYRDVQNRTNPISNKSTVYYSQSNSPIRLEFTTHKLLKIYSTPSDRSNAKWFWKDKKKEYITIDDEAWTGDYYIIELNKKELSISKTDIYSEEMVLLNFRHPGDPYWPDDDLINMMNSSNKK